MANPTELANKARTTLMSALQALQTEDVPDALQGIAEPIAETMGILHRIEKTGNADAEECSKALNNVRGALDSLQNVGEPHSAVDQAMEAVAGSLSKLFALNKSVRPSTPPMAPQGAPQAHGTSGKGPHGYRGDAARQRPPPAARGSAHRGASCAAG